MGTEIYYFSGTGNSLAVARDIAEKMNGKLISIPSVIDKESIATDADAIGIVRSRGGRLAAGFGVQMPQNAFDKPLENREKLFNGWKTKKLAAICDQVNAKKSGRLETDGFVSRLVIALLLAMMKTPLLRPVFIKSIYKSAGCQTNLNLPFAEVMPLIDRSYHADENCTGCGICTEVCSVHNIKMVDRKPAWQHRCENCLACINWCPQKAIHGYAELPNLKRYHHPEVKLTDMMKQGKKITGDF